MEFICLCLVFFIYANVVLQILQNEQQTWYELVKYVKENNVDCELWIGDTLDVPITPEAAENAKRIYESYKAAGGNVDHIKITHSPQEAAEVLIATNPWIYLIDITDGSLDFTNKRCTSLLCMASVNATPLETCGTCDE